MERTLVLIKPDGVQRGLVGPITTRLELRGLQLIAAKFLLVKTDLAEKHYAMHKGKPFYKGLITYLTSSPMMAMVWSGPEAVAVVRQTMGATNPLEAAPGSIRHDYSILISRNLTHASDSIENAMLEISNWFEPSEIIEWSRQIETWVTGLN